MDHDYILEVRYPRGRMRIVADRMFPGTKKELRTILGALDRNPDRGYRRMTGQELRRWMAEKVAELEDETALRGLANKAVDFRTSAKEMDETIEKQKKRIASLEATVKQTADKAELKKTKAELKDEKGKLKAMTGRQAALVAEAKSCEADFEKRRKTAARLRENMDVLDGYLAAWEW